MTLVDDPPFGPSRPNGGIVACCLRTCLALLLAVSANGCGYGFVSGGGVTRVAEGRVVSVGPVENLSADAEAGLLVARRLGQELAARGLSGRNAALELRGTVESLSATPAGVGGGRTSSGLPQRVSVWRAEGRLVLRLVDLSVVPPKTIATSSVSSSEQYLPGDDVEATEVSRALATQRLVEVLVEQGLERLR